MEVIDKEIETAAPEAVSEPVHPTQPHQEPPASKPEEALVRVPGDLRVGGSDEMLQILALIQSGQLPLTDGIENALAARLLPAPPPMPASQPRGQQDLLAVALVLGLGFLGICLAAVLIARMGDSSRDRGYQTSITNLVEQNSKLAKENRSSCIGIFITCPAPVTQAVNEVPTIEPVPQVPAAVERIDHQVGRDAVMAATVPDEVEEPRLSEQDYQFYKKVYRYWQQQRGRRATVKQMKVQLKQAKPRYTAQKFAIVQKALNDFITTL